jgi:hypothetical protein
MWPALVILSMIFSVISAVNEKVILNESFNYPDGGLPSSWWSEGNPAKIKEGRLFVDADTTGFRNSTVWLDRNLSGNIRLTFDVHVISSRDTANNINCFFLYSASDGKPLRETKAQRVDGSYDRYHALNGYIFTYLANGQPRNGRLRFRDNPGFKLLEEKFGFECRRGESYKVSIVKQANKLQYWVDGKKLLDKVDDLYNAPHQTGLFGFRTWHTSLWWDNLVITQLD